MTNIYGVQFEQARKREIAQAEAVIRKIVAEEIALAKDKAHYRSVINESKSRLDVYYAQKEAEKR